MPVNQTYEESDLLLQIAEGDERAFYALYDKYADLLMPFLRYYTQSDTDLEEIIQETFIKVWLNRDKLPAVRNLRNWIFTIAARIYLNQVAKDQAVREKMKRHSAAQVSADMLTPYNMLHSKHIKDIIHQAVVELPARRAQIFRMNREMGMKPAQIAEELKIPLSTVKNQLSLALKEIRDRLMASGYGPAVVLMVIVRIF